MENVGFNNTAVMGAGDDLMGASSIRVIVPQLIEFFPLIAMLQAVSGATTLDGRAVAIISVLRFFANKTNTPIDNEFLDRLEAVLRTQQGMELLQWTGRQIEGIVVQDSIARASASQAVA